MITIEGILGIGLTLATYVGIVVMAKADDETYKK